MNERHVVILGGGITGLAAAYRLRELSAQQGVSLRCTVCERDSRWGGKIRTHRGAEGTVELGPDSIFTRKRGGIELIRELGLEPEMVPVGAGGALVLHRGRLRPLPPGMSLGFPSDLPAMARTPLLSPLGKARALADLILPRTGAGGDLSVGRFLRRRLGHELVDAIAAPLLAGIHAGDIDRLSLDATMPHLRALSERHRSLIVGAAAQKRRRPQGETQPSPLFATLRGGLEALVERLVERLDGFAEMRLQTNATEISPRGDQGYRVAAQSGGNAVALDADAVVVALPAHAAAAVFARLDLDARLLRSIRYVSTATVSLGYDEDVVPPGMTASGFVVPPKEKRAITACTLVSNKWPSMVPEGFAAIRCYVGRDGDEAGVRLDDGRIVAEVRRELRDVLGVRAVPKTARVTRWMDAMPQYDVGHVDRVAELDRQAARYPGLVLAGAAYRGMGIPDCIVDADRAAGRVMAHLSSLSGDSQTARLEAFAPSRDGSLSKKG